MKEVEGSNAGLIRPGITKDKTEELLVGSLLEPIETHADRLGILGSNR
jgi:hypothetical protein